MEEKLREFLKDNIVRISLSTSLLLLFAQSALLFITYKDLPPYVPVFNSMPWGDDRLFTSQILFFLPLLLLLIFLINNFFGTLFYKKYTLASRILSFNAFLFIILGIVGYVQILILIF